MPNWCWNTATITHDDPAMIDRLAKSCETGILQEFVPCPKELLETVSSPGTQDEELKKIQDSNIEKYGYPDWYDWCVYNWGTKWDVTVQEPERITPNELHIGFESAWAPPIGAYRKLNELGFSIDAYYQESGMGFAGRYVDEIEEYVEYDFENENWRETMSDELADMLESEYENYLMWKEEESEENK